MSRRQVIIDTDPGVDDAAAILLALASPELEVLGITVVAGNVPLHAALANACRIVGLADRADVPVLPGASGPLLRDQVFGKHAKIGAFPERLVGSGSVTAGDERAASFIARMAVAAAREARPITLCAIGPLTNVALALRLHPDVAAGIGEIVCMGGAFATRGLLVPWAEFNVYADPHAAAIVWGSGVPVTLFPLDVTTQALFTADHIAGFAQSGGMPGIALANLLREHDRSDISRYGRPGGPLHDPMTVAWLLDPEAFSTRPAQVEVQVAGKAAGHTLADFGAESSGIAVATHVDEVRYASLLIDRLGRYAAGTAAATRQGGAA